MRDEQTVWRCRYGAVTICAVVLVLGCATVLGADRTAVDKTMSSVQDIIKAPSAAQKIPSVTAPVLKAVHLWDIVNGAPNYNVSYRRQVQVGFRYAGTHPTHYRLSENNQFERTSWRAFKVGARYSYTFLRNTDGQKTVYAQLRYGEGTKYLSQVIQASIHYRRSPTISNFQIQNGAANVSKRQVVLTWSVSGIATNYRVSESANMAGASWKAGSGPPAGGLVFDLAEGAAGPPPYF